MAEKKMKSKRLTDALIHTVLDKAKAWKFGKEEAKLLKRENVLAEKIYNHFVPAEVLAALEVVNAWDNTDARRAEDYSLDGPVVRQLAKRAGLGSNRLGVGDYAMRFAEGEAKLLPYTGWRYFEFSSRHFEAKPLPGKLLRELVKFLEDGNVLAVRHSEFHGELRKLCFEVRTTAKLVEVLPEAADWIPEVYHCTDMPQADHAAKLLSI